jgi:methylenetetrahydrofolate reductase (NADPH)
MAENHLRSALQRRQFFVSAELVLNRDHTAPELEALVEAAAAEPRGLRIISITDLPGGNPALPPEALVAGVLERGLTPLAHLSGKDGNRSFVEARLHALARAGAENVLALTGDAQRSGFLGRGQPGYDLDSVLILHLIESLRSGLEYRLGKRTARTSAFDFLAGAVVNPYKVREPDLMMQLHKLELKLAVGARFVVTQLGYDLRKLYELEQYLDREGLGEVPLVANVYVPTATVARMMQAGEIAGCVVPDALVARLEKETKAERLERGALMLAACRDLGFSGAHLGGFGLAHRDMLGIVDRAEEIGAAWRARADELSFPWPGGKYLFPEGTDGLSDGSGPYQIPAEHPSPTWGARLGRADCGDCLQDHLGFVGCTMRWCYKTLRNGPCGGSRPDGSCEVDAGRPCIWNRVYLGALAAGGTRADEEVSRC